MSISTLPTELVREIILYAVHNACPSTLVPATASRSKPEWKCIENLSLVSRTFRILFLEAWFEIFVAKDPSDLLQIDIYSQISSWTSQLHCRDRDRALHDDDTQWDLRRFPRVCKLRLDVDPLDYNYRLRFRHTPPALQELEMHDHPWPSPMVMQSIAETFPELRVLKLSQNAIWCGLCNTCNVASFNVPPPSPLVYTSGKGLPSHYHQFLAPLVHLQTVHLIHFEVNG
ncbi:hypothetical protein AcW1_009919 [Taiwanofungus camphoratus]|nr:hypothetical protein AcV5_003246 [Antrodia cinnamomea]KAI0929415.1 hypothetical protein AcV7_005270 [Antrodia cinnamomea]KAI0946466.1 hypothetical protein AcW1_009919 [Antrodia cinnamomea]